MSTAVQEPGEDGEDFTLADMGITEDEFAEMQVMVEEHWKVEDAMLRDDATRLLTYVVTAIRNGRRELLPYAVTLRDAMKAGEYSAIDAAAMKAWYYLTDV